ncbi:hypothetical protein NC652_006600 [Populus alba x Populus x berolinensis]|nr:hypothetical protein NC652_006600 [Populus alba x Populus x berolinensis]
MHRSRAVMAWNVFKFCTALRGLGSIMILLVLGVVVVTYYAVVLNNYGPALYDGDIDSLVSLAVLITFHSLLVMLLWSYFSVVLTDPGSVPPNWRPAIDEERGEADPLNGSEFSGVQSDQLNQRIRYCRKCNQLKPPRCHHCSVCGRCVLKMDHHCVWVVNCVGALNYKYFLLFLFYTFLETSLVTLSLLPHFIAFFSDGEIPGTPGTLATTFLAFVLNLAFALSVLGFLIMHISLVSANTTTIEFVYLEQMSIFQLLLFCSVAFSESLCLLCGYGIRNQAISVEDLLVELLLSCFQAYEKKTTPKWRYDLGRKKNFEQASTFYKLFLMLIMCERCENSHGWMAIKYNTRFILNNLTSFSKCNIIALFHCKSEKHHISMPMLCSHDKCLLALRNVSEVFGADKRFWFIPAYSDEDTRRMPALQGLEYPSKPDFDSQEF